MMHEITIRVDAATLACLMASSPAERTQRDAIKRAQREAITEYPPMTADELDAVETIFATYSPELLPTLVERRKVARAKVS